MANEIKQLFSKDTFVNASVIVAGLGSITIISRAVYNLVFHPLAKIPGPRWNAVSGVPFLSATVRGDQPFYLHRLHELYGDIVRIGPNSLSFASPGAAKELYAGNPGAPELRKDPLFYAQPPNGVHSILSEPSQANHHRQRRLLNPGFSDRAIREQESVVSQYVDLLMQRLRENSTRGAQDMVAWFNWTTFDVIGDLTFNQPFGCLENSAYHPWITAIFNSVKSLVILGGLNQYPPAKRLILLLFSKQINSARNSSNIFTKKMVAHRTSSNTDRIDFLSYALNHRSDTEFMTPGEIESTSVILILGGSETSATLLSGAVYYLLKHPRMMQKLVEEIRGQFQKKQDINIVTVSKLTYLQAVIKEALRIFPPVTIGSPRLVEGDGKAIAGIMVPGGTSVVSNMYVTSHSSRNWVNPHEFAPERWLDGDDFDRRFEVDQRAASIPFSLGRRDCIGKNLAHVEMRLILARVLFNFDLELDNRSDNWAHELKVYSLWEKKPLLVNLKCVDRRT